MRVRNTSASSSIVAVGGCGQGHRWLSADWVMNRVCAVRGQGPIGVELAYARRGMAQWFAPSRAFTASGSVALQQHLDRGGGGREPRTPEWWHGVGRPDGERRLPRRGMLYTW